MKKTYLKKSISMFFALLFLVSLSSLTTEAKGIERKSKKIDGVKFKYNVIDDKFIEITRGEFFVPEEIDGLPVTMIGDYSYEDMEHSDDGYSASETVRLTEKYKNFSIPETVTYIGKYAFSCNYFIKTLSIPSSVTYIGNNAFEKCGLEKIIIPSGIRTINKKTFFGCNRLKEVNFGESVEEIKEAAFMGCVKLSKITFHRLDIIRERAFFNCTSLKSVNTINTALRFCDKQAFGYYSSDNKIKRVKGFSFICNSKSELSFDYPIENGFKIIYKLSSTEKNIALNPGVVCRLNIDNKFLKDFNAKKNKTFKLTKNGNLTMLKKGSAKFSVTLANGKKLKGSIKSNNNPSISVWNKTYKSYYSSDKVTIKKGKSIRCKLEGKVYTINNKYYNNKYAKVTSKKSARYIKIKGVKKGSSTIKIKINGVKTLKLKVKVV